MQTIQVLSFFFYKSSNLTIIKHRFPPKVGRVLFLCTECSVHTVGRVQLWPPFFMLWTDRARDSWPWVSYTPSRLRRGCWAVRWNGPSCTCMPNVVPILPDRKFYLSILRCMRGFVGHWCSCTYSLFRVCDVQYSLTPWSTYTYTDTNASNSTVSWHMVFFRNFF